MENIITVPSFWDCGCESNYIHPKTHNNCNKCGAESNDSPDSRINEILEYTLPLFLYFALEQGLGI